MKFEPQCKKQSDLHREWARVLDMFAGTGVTGFWRIGDLQFSGAFDCWTIEPERVEWPIAKVEGKPVFRGDVLYSFTGTKFEVEEMRGPFLCEVGYSDRWHGISQMPQSCTWNPPRCTITINGVEVPAEVPRIEDDDTQSYVFVSGRHFWYNNRVDAITVRDAIWAALEGKQP